MDVTPAPDADEAEPEATPIVIVRFFGVDFFVVSVTR